MIITIDGPAGTGKSTVAKRLAEKIGFSYVDTGAMYRIISFGVLKKGVDLNNEDRLRAFLEAFTYQVSEEGGGQRYLYEGQDITSQIREGEVTALVSLVAAKKAVREKLVAMQRELARDVDAVVEGRDIGTVVFPHAELKIFLTARPEVRALRRFRELKQKFPEKTKSLLFEEVLDGVLKRDELDMTREHSPLQAADDAIVVDTSDLTIEEVVATLASLRQQLQ